MAVSVTDKIIVHDLTVGKLLQATHVEATEASVSAMQRLGVAVACVVENYLGNNSNVPGEVKEQAVIQAVGYVWESPASAPARMNFANALHNSGAAALLAPWRVHKAGVIG